MVFLLGYTKYSIYNINSNQKTEKELRILFCQEGRLFLDAQESTYNRLTPYMRGNISRYCRIPTYICNISHGRLKPSLLHATFKACSHIAG